MGRRLKGKSMEVPPPFVNLKVSRGQRGGAIPGRRSLEGVGGVLGSMGNFLVALFIFIQEVCFHSLGSSGVVGPAWTSFWLTEWNERRQIG